LEDDDMAVTTCEIARGRKRACFDCLNFNSKCLKLQDVRVDFFLRLKGQNNLDHFCKEPTAFWLSSSRVGETSFHYTVRKFESVVLVMLIQINLGLPHIT
jgi:hypothetical protein